MVVRGISGSHFELGEVTMPYYVNFVTDAGTIAYNASPFSTLNDAMDYGCTTLNLGATFVHVVDHKMKECADFAAIKKHFGYP
jgi:hypothetical protein